MATPKKKTSHSRAGMRKGGNGAYKTTIPNIIIDKTTGEYKLPHHISLDGYYNEKKIFDDKVKNDNKENKDLKDSEEAKE